MNWGQKLFYKLWALGVIISLFLVILPEPVKKVYPTEQFINALIRVESGGNDLAIGDRGLSGGCLQIKDIVVEDVNRISGERFVSADRFSRGTSIRICQIYLKHYATKERIGREPTYEDMARIWNGGPDGWKKPETIPYWNKLKTIYAY